MTGSIQIHTLVSAPFQENSYIAWLNGRSDALVIDPGLEPDLILHFLEAEGLTVAAILNTHGHGDHIAGNGDVKGAFPSAPLIIGTHEARMLVDPEENLSALFGTAIVSPPADRLVNEGDVVEAAGIRLEVLEVPGHSPGHIVFVHRGAPTIVFGGDVLFRGSIGRCDFPNSDGPLLLEGIRTKLYTLPNDTVIYSGHGPPTTIGQERRSNPFVQG